VAAAAQPAAGPAGGHTVTQPSLPDDAAFAKLLDEEAGVYEAIAADIRERPHDYVLGGSVGG